MAGASRQYRVVGSTRYNRSTSRSEQEGPDWNMVCEGNMLFFEDTDTAVITK